MLRILVPLLFLAAGSAQAQDLAAARQVFVSKCIAGAQAKSNGLITASQSETYCRCVSDKLLTDADSAGRAVTLSLKLQANDPAAAAELRPVVQQCAVAAMGH